ncbi:hypothetical protein MNBD_UNCLBAC01-1577 [hydrothermal vent metagenome]|uniref:Type II secretion envelope pseudopilin protein (PulG,guides folded protein to PulD in outer membrane) n=1 Tax=hydrothermal vent metagenome TaxID=652676 RepID=A0A3B1DD95_9ZZZZ
MLLSFFRLENMVTILRKNSAFTLTEIIIVIVIIGVMAGFVLPRYTLAMERMRVSEGVQILISLLGAQKRYEMENGVFADDYADLDVTIPISDNFDSITNDEINTSDPVVDVVRTGDYTLSIDEDGTISCTDSGSPIYTCAQVGY